MRQRLVVNGWPGRVLLAALVLLTIAIGVCLFDGHEHETAGHGPSFDLCFGLAILSVAAVVLAFVSMHGVRVDPPCAVHAVPLLRLDPPPKSPSLS